MREEFRSQKKPYLRTLSKRNRFDLRIEAVFAVKGGKPAKQVAEKYGVSQTTINNWINAFESGGETTFVLKPKPLGRPRGSGKLSQRQATSAILMIKEHTPDQLGIPYALWTKKSVQELIYREFGFEPSIRGVDRWLKEWGFKQELSQNLHIQNVVTLKRSITFWCNILDLYPCDSTDQTKINERFRYRMIAAVPKRGMMRFMAFTGELKAETFLEFLRRLIESIYQETPTLLKPTVLLVVNEQPVQHEDRVQQWLRKNAGKICLVN